MANIYTQYAALREELFCDCVYNNNDDIRTNLALGLYPSSDVFLYKQRFGNWLCFRLQVKVGGSSTLWGPLERVKSQPLDKLGLTLSKGPHRVGATPYPPFNLKTETEPVSEKLFLKKKHRTMDTVLKQDYSKCITPSSEPSRIDDHVLTQRMKNMYKWWPFASFIFYLTVSLINEPWIFNRHYTLLSLRM
jgi:hypothetical protein